MKKEYMKPTVHVVVLQQHRHILAGSPSAKNLSSSPEGIIWDLDGLEDDDDLR